MRHFYSFTLDMNTFIFILLFTALTVTSINGELLFSLACTNADQTCILYKINIDQSSNLAVSNEIAKLEQTRITDRFGSVAGFKNGKMPYIVLTNNCNQVAYLINITNLAQTPSSITMKTPCTQPIHLLAGRYLLALGTNPNNVGGSTPGSLYEFDAISGRRIRGKVFTYFLDLNKIKANEFAHIIITLHRYC
jgi:hypothetical protein